ncbi:superoxide dismutase family protein [Leptothermofonsia sp. ETS-13]|uniref:superoxide dismutase family protein n=1 Tax=Leptothermofonsia sp. ETS-13 TaxID=3035696 RepID=UPI003BA393F7
MNPTRRFVRGLIVAVLLSLLAFLYIGVQGAIATPNPDTRTAQATLSDPSGKSNLNGQVSIFETAKGLLLKAAVSDTPAGLHGFHIHEKGSCKDGGNGAGGHFNPDQVKHGKLIIDGFANAHAGDLGNILIGLDGTGSMAQTIPGLRLTEGKYAIANRAIILHAQKDDFGQPTGNAGGRIGCGVIALSK